MNAKNGHIIKELEFVKSIEYKSSVELQAIQEDRLIKLLRHAWENTDYYREVLSACGVVRDGVVNLTKFEDVPLLTKDILHQQHTRLKAKKLPSDRKAYINRTGGSTGQPTEFWQDTYYDAVNIADKLYYFETMGKEIGDPEMKIWGSPRDLVTDTSGWSAPLRNFLYNRDVQTCSRLSDAGIERIIRNINEFRPKIIWGYIDGMYAISDYVLRHEKTLHRPAAIFCGGGTVFPSMADMIENAFHCPVTNFYGSREMGAVACQCRGFSHLHIASHSHRVEVLDAEGMPVVEQDGDLVITSTTNYAMPFIRYRVGDRAQLTATHCPCGRGFPLLGSVSGRHMESLIGPNGELISPIYLITMIGVSVQAGLIRKFQIVQDDYTHVTFKAIVNPEASRDHVQEIVDEICRKIEGLMGKGCIATPSFVEDIPPQASGKYLYTICNIPADQRPSQATERIKAYRAPVGSAAN
ncbi:MAG: hypothetical protein O7F12_04185 [Nitrospirae bacterium]|nr:hypothetical protein [Nitrospirota bacterium]